ncbi:methyltransferase domain-containing protein [Paenibacillus sp. MMS18-CY102]|uniref:methyltransferase domain-containing protein n=1 Tax=Paenibacillus sp. MMS18-CY102 TaxID=2682849 RepID=UPI001365BEA0|nr:methyltransferase domain-containing protein [Paenibacillus sp. MMS18-CY102]
MHNIYTSTAKWYDADNRAVVQADIPFYIDRAQQLGGNVLELACGTGRITIPLAEAGIPVTGLDYSPHMLEVLHGKLQSKPQRTKEHVRTIQGDMTSFTFPEAYSLIFIPFRSFQLLENDEQALQCLNNIACHLDDNGQFILNVFRPDQGFTDTWVRLEEQLDFESELANGEKVTRSSVKRATPNAACCTRTLFTACISKMAP